MREALMPPGRQQYGGEAHLISSRRPATAPERPFVGVDERDFSLEMQKTVVIYGLAAIRGSTQRTSSVDRVASQDFSCLLCGVDWHDLKRSLAAIHHREARSLSDARDYTRKHCPQLPSIDPHVHGCRG